MNENKVKTWLYVVIAVAVAGVSAFFQSLLEKNYLETESGFYEYGASTPSAFVFFIGVAAVLMCTAFFTLRKDSLPRDMKYGSVPTSIASILCACTVVFTSVTCFMSEKGSLGMLTVDNAEKMKDICALLAFPSAIYYFTVAFSIKNKSKFAPWFSFFPVIWSLFYLMGIYFDQTVPLNSPVRILRQFAVILLMLYQLFETRALLGKSKPIVYFVLSNVSVILLSAGFFPELISIFNGTARIDSETVYTLFFGAEALYVLTRAMTFAVYSDGEMPKEKKHYAPKDPLKEDLFASDEDEGEEQSGAEESIEEN